MKLDIKFELDSNEFSSQAFQALLHQESLLTTVSQIIERIDRDLGNVFCAVHKQYPHITLVVRPDTSLDVDITGCCEALVRTAKTYFKSEVVHTAYFVPHMRLRFHIDGEEQPLVFDAEQVSPLVIGRSDPSLPLQPDIDLSPYSGSERGISRRHAAIIWHNGALHIVDEGSANGTSINGQQLVAHQPYPLRNGDEITLGDITLKLFLEL